MSNVEFQSGEMVFEWDSEKAKRNKIKHGIGFKLATRVFEDEDRIEKRDDEHSQDEERWQVIGKVENILFVVYTERGEKIRLISAREASPIEKEWYSVDARTKRGTSCTQRPPDCLRRRLPAANARTTEKIQACQSATEKEGGKLNNEQR